MLALAAAALIGAAALVGAGCDGETGPGARQRGREVFAEDCSRCHTLSGRERGAVGGDLARTRLSVADLASFARVMPARTPLSVDDSRAVAEYVREVAASLERSGR